ncbi:hypothetical protein D8B26_008379 [Coccidioides posadasii str. Silveira]|uniref:uncharacterized protein n=1 Tax=Coccidioides posadasii (strain RMSCC 757 / Silveira) TaxID=443226 RepID=UPI001BF163FE|nr:hypothetical protein D8B26_008379 [Coccidioides posadasii str. Silveira]
MRVETASLMRSPSAAMAWVSPLLWLTWEPSRTLAGFRTTRHDGSQQTEQAAESALTVTSKNSSYFVHKDTFLVGLALLIPLNDPSNYVIWKKDRRMASYHNKATVAATAASTDILKSYLSSAKADPSILKSSEAAKLFAVEIGKKLLDLLLKHHEGLKTSLPLLDLGLDSLVALELRAWIKQVFYFDLPILEMMSIGSLDILGQYAANEVYRIATENKDS